MGKFNMANFETVSRTNYFTVKDINAFKAEMNELDFQDFSWFDGENGTVAFGGYEETSRGWSELLDEDVEVSDIIMKHIVEGDACIYVEACNEKLRYVGSYGFVATSKEVKNLNMDTFLIQHAKDMLNNQDFQTVMHY